MLAATDLETVVAHVDKWVRATIGPRHAVETHLALRGHVAFIMREGGDGDKKMSLTTLLWLALNHPAHGDRMRAEMSKALRRDGKTHLSVTVDWGRMWSFALAQRFVDMASLVAALPENTPVSLSMGEATPDRPMH